jgi:hypothetical protein
MAETEKERQDATRAVWTNLDQSVQGLLPLAGVPVTPYRLARNATLKRRKAAPARRTAPTKPAKKGTQ